MHRFRQKNISFIGLLNHNFPILSLNLHKFLLKVSLPDVSVSKILFFLIISFANYIKCVTFYVSNKWVQRPLKFSVRKIFQQTGNT